MKIAKFILGFLVILTLLSSCVSPQPSADHASPSFTSTVNPDSLPHETDGFPWWNNTVFYEIFVRSFYDSNHDGIGDINGIIQKLDYLNDGDPNTQTDLGITGIWLMPLNPSGTYHGYAVEDYYDINPDYGTLDDFKKLLEEAHNRGIRVIIDLVLNHTSSAHPWFVDADNPNSPYHDWYIWSDTDPGYGGSWGQKVWYPHQGKFYYATFDSSMPDLNYNNPEVKAEMEKVVSFWLKDVGVDGFRLDAAKHIIEEGSLQANTQSTHEWWKSFRPIYKSINPDSMIVGEIWDETPIMAEYLQGDQFDLSFEFKLAQAFINAVNNENAFNANFQMKFSYNQIPSLRYATFLANHDQNRLMNQLNQDPEKVKAAASLLLTSPGVPFLYYGEEIGMQGEKPDELIRAPMQWSGEPNAGFSTAVPWEPVGEEWQTFNIVNEQNDPDSIWAHYQKLIQARIQSDALRVGNLAVISTGTNDLYAILRQSEDEAVIVLVNLSDSVIDKYSLTLKESELPEGSYSPQSLFEEVVLEYVSVTKDGAFYRYQPVSEIQPYVTILIKIY